MFSLTSTNEVLNQISSRFERERLTVSEGTAIVWLKGDLLPDTRERIVQELMDDPAITNVFFTRQKVNVVHIGFHYDRVDYEQIMSRVHQIHQNAVIVGF